MEDLNTLAISAIAIHEMFVSLVKAGFTEEQALELVKAMLTRPPV